ncbi:MAG: phosphate uptake regulator PhoU [Nitrososphaerales archaeon]
MVKYARRLQKIGSSALVSLPKEWIKHNKLDKGDTVIVEVGRDNLLVVYPSGTEQEEVKESVIQFPSKYKGTIVNEITGAYLLGYDIIKVKSSLQISYDDREIIKGVIGKMVGLEIVDEDAYKITAQFLLDATTLDPEKILYRMSSIVSGMYKDTLASLTNKEPNLLRIITRRDDEVDRQYFLLVRLIRSAIMNPKLASKLNLVNIDMLDYRIAANLFEGAGDATVELAKAISTIDQLKKSSDLKMAGELIETMQDIAVRAFANKNRDDSIKAMKQYANFSNLLDSVKQNAVTTTLNVIYEMDKIAKCWIDVVDLVKPIPYASTT